MKSIISKVLCTLLFGLFIVTSPAFAATHHVNCDKGKTISKALETAKGSAQVFEILVSGTCVEDVTIRRDNVYIVGNPDATIEGFVRVFSSSGVSFENIAISSQGNGLLVSGNANASLRWVQIRDNGGNGLMLRRRASVFVRDSTIENNGGFGVFVEDSSLQTNNSQIMGNASYGIFADLGSQINLTTTEVAFNGAPGVQVMLHSVIDLRDGTYFHDNMFHGLYAVEDSAIRISAEDVIVDGNIGCEDNESSFANRGGASEISTDCSDFN